MSMFTSYIITTESPPGSPQEGDLLTRQKWAWFSQGAGSVTGEGSRGDTLKVQLQNNVDSFYALLQTTLSDKMTHWVSGGLS